VPFVQLDPDCECYSSCLVWGDPYIQQLSGERARINENSFVVYENRDVAIQADMEAYNSTQVVTFKQNGEQPKFVRATDCVGRSNRYILFNATVGSVAVEVYCHDKPSNSSQLRAPHYLNTLVKIRSNGEAPNPILNELEEGASGECVKLSGDFEPVDDNGTLPIDISPSTCKCTHTCGSFGDPHITTFGGEVGILDVPSYSTIFLYILHNQTVRAEMDKMLHVQSLEIIGEDNKTLAATSREENCYDDKMKDAKVPVWEKTVDSYDGGEIKVQVYCNTRPNNKPLDHFYYDVVLTKTDSTTGVFYDTFLEMQQARSATGQCIQMSSHHEEDINVE